MLYQNTFFELGIGIVSSFSGMALKAFMKKKLFIYVYIAFHKMGFQCQCQVQRLCFSEELFTNAYMHLYVHIYVEHFC